MVPEPVGSEPIGMGGSAVERGLERAGQGRAEASGSASMMLTMGATTADGLSSTGWPGVPLTVVAQLPMTIGVAASVASAVAATPAVVAARPRR